MTIDYLNGRIKRLNDRGVESWATRDELAFIVGLGSHRNGSNHHPLSDQVEMPDRKTLLVNYLKASVDRKDWGDVDPTACIEMAETLLVSEQNQEE